MYLIMELCKGGELSIRLREKTYFKEEVRSSECTCMAVCMTVFYTLKEAKAIMRRLTEALVYMHDNGEYVPSN